MTTLFSIFALRGRDRDNPSLRGRSTENYEQRMELIGGGQTCTITSVQKDNLLMEVYEIAGNALDATSRNCDVGAPQLQTDLFLGM